SDLSEIVRIVYYGREKVHRGHQRSIPIEAVDGRIVRGAGVDQHRWIVERDQVTQDLRQLGSAEFTRSTGAVREMAEPDPRPLIPGGVLIRHSVQDANHDGSWHGIYGVRPDRAKARPGAGPVPISKRPTDSGRRPTPVVPGLHEQAVFVRRGDRRLEQRP